MAPTLRSTSSAQNSPSTERTMTLSNASTPTTTPRKTPHCTKCKRPRVGHPRSGCPYADSDSPSKGTSTDKPLSKATDTHLSDALGTLKLASPARTQQVGRAERDEDSKAFVRERRRRSTQPAGLQASESLLSLSTNSSEIVARLREPGMFDFDNNTKGGKIDPSKIVRWQEAIITPPTPATKGKSKMPGRSPMPGTLIPPTPETSLASIQSSLYKQETPGPVVSFSVSQESEAATEPSYLQRTQPLRRTMSAEERDLFVSRLAEEAAATIYIVPKANLDAIVADALALKFHVNISMNEDDETDDQALLILGRSESALNALVERVETENNKARQSKAGGLETPQKPPTASAFRVAAGGAVVGAVTAWAGLAFS